MQTQDNTPMCYQRGNQSTQRKTSPPPSQKYSIHQTISWETRIARDLPSLIYLIHLSPPSSYSNKASRNHVLSSSLDPAIHPIASTKAWLLPMRPSSTKTSLDTLKGCGKCLGYQPLMGMEMERQELRKIYNKLCGELWV